MAELLPQLRIGQDLEHLVGDVGGIRRVHQETVVQGGHDVHGPPVLGGHRGYPVRRSLQMRRQGAGITGVIQHIARSLTNTITNTITNTLECVRKEYEGDKSVSEEWTVKGIVREGGISIKVVTGNLILGVKCGNWCVFG